MPRQRVIPQGYELNPLTNRKVKINSRTYKKVFKQLKGDRNNRKSLVELFKTNGIDGVEGFDIDPYSNTPIRTNSARYKRLFNIFHGSDYESPLKLSTLRELDKLNTRYKKSEITYHPRTNEVIIVGTPQWDEIYKYYKWDGKNRKFTTVRKNVLPSYYNDIEKRRNFRKGKYSAVNKGIEDGSLLKTSMGSFITMYHTQDGKIDSIHHKSPREKHDFNIYEGTNFVRIQRKGTNDEKIAKDYDCVHEDGKTQTKEQKEENIKEVCTRMVEYIKRCETDAPQYYICLTTIDEFGKMDRK